jgi:hypothetical protein
MFALLLLTLGSVPPSIHAGPYDRTLCPPILGQFILRSGALWLIITKEHGKPVTKRTEKIANPLDERSHEVLLKRGPVRVEAHKDKRGGLFVHWGTLANDRS